MVDLQVGSTYHRTIEKGVATMAKTAKGSLAKKEVVVDLRKVKELQRLLKAETEGEAVRMAIDESVANLRVSRSLNRFLDALAKEQSSFRA
ncbi:MAG: hypothetical protein FJ143_00445 [Deltaproteobacteria bacterium]|nr:hypothetical protein [Deltaproteobacteria bacterium]